MPYKPEVQVEGKWSGNALVFETLEECERYGRDLLSRWFVPTGARSVETDEPANYAYTDRGPVRLELDRADFAGYPRDVS